jgi:hypothetical protein
MAPKAKGRAPVRSRRQLAASPAWHRPVHCSLNRPIGPQRQVAVVRADLSRLATKAHRHHATVNDILLTAAAEALWTVLAEDGENVSALVVSVPVSAGSQPQPRPSGMTSEPCRYGFPALDPCWSGSRAPRQRRGRDAAVMSPGRRSLRYFGCSCTWASSTDSSAVNVS